MVLLNTRVSHHANLTGAVAPPDITTDGTLGGRLLTDYQGTLPDPSIVLQALTTRDPVSLNALPEAHGIYALHDHTRRIRYIGITREDKYGFHGRINNRHVSGSEGRSHKFSHAYNTGRMWRAKKDTGPDAVIAKRLRVAFIRRYCRATYVIVSPTLWCELPKLEVAVQALAPRGMLDWGGKRSFLSVPEPAELVDALLEELCFTPDQRAAVERQAAKRCRTL